MPKKFDSPIKMSTDATDSSIDGINIDCTDPAKPKAAFDVTLTDVDGNVVGKLGEQEKFMDLLDADGVPKLDPADHADFVELMRLMKEISHKYLEFNKVSPKGVVS